MGLVLPFEENENAILGYHDSDEYLSGPFLDIPAIREDANRKIEQYDIRPPNSRLKTANFSGGNQQKIVLAREMEQDPVVLLVGQPTRGVDVGAKKEIYQIIHDLAEQGLAVVFVSSELPELLGLADRIVVMNSGEIVGGLSGDATEEQVIELSMLHAATPILTGEHP